jgi:hypothetical protein
VYFFFVPENFVLFAHIGLSLLSIFLTCVTNASLKIYFYSIGSLLCFISLFQARVINSTFEFAPDESAQISERFVLR